MDRSTRVVREVWRTQRHTARPHRLVKNLEFPVNNLEFADEPPCVTRLASIYGREVGP